MYINSLLLLTDNWLLVRQSANFEQTKLKFSINELFICFCELYNLTLLFYRSSIITIYEWIWMKSLFFNIWLENQRAFFIHLIKFLICFYEERCSEWHPIKLKCHVIIMVWKLCWYKQQGWANRFKDSAYCDTFK